MELQNFRSTIAVHTKYHAFRLAEGLDKLGVLDRIYTTYPKFKLGSYNLPQEKIKSFWLLGAVKYFNSHYGPFISDNFVTSFFDDWVSAVLKNPGGKWIFTGYSGFCEKSLKKAKKLGAITLVERACPHIDEQEELTSDEKSRLLGKIVLPETKEVYKRMKREYDIADYIVVPSEYSRKSFVKRGVSPEKLITVPLCNEKDVVLKRQLGEYPQVFTVLCVSGNFYRKGLIYLLRAWRELGLRNAKLIVKGEIPKEFSDLKTIPNLAIISRHLSDEEMVGLYNRVTVCAVPSIDDGFAMVVVEAMRAAVPVIVTQNVGAADIVEEGKDGFVVPIRNVEALKEKILYFYNNPDKVKEMGQNVIKKSEQYTPMKYAERMVRVYEKIS